MTEAAVLGFWFADGDAPRDAWFTVDPAFDRAVAAALGPLRDDAEAGRLTDWLGTADGALALIILLDQVPRNLFRGTPRAFATDPQARAAAVHAVAAGYDRGLAPVRRWFLYLPFEHSEALADQERALTLFAGLADDPASAESIDAARRHHAIIARFGRFPHRNAALGRASTPEELQFLTQPGSSF